MADEPTAKRARGRAGNLASNLFALAALVFAVLAVALFIRDSRNEAPPVPTAIPGSNQIANVTDALEAQGLEVEAPPRLFIPRGALQAPGQGIEVDGTPGFIFLYPDVEAARADAAGADPDQIVPERLAETPAPAGARRLTQGSNVIVVLVGGSEETWQKVEAAVASLR